VGPLLVVGAVHKERTITLTAEELLHQTKTGKTDGWTDKQTNRQTDRQRHSQYSRYGQRKGHAITRDKIKQIVDRQTDRQTDRRESLSQAGISSHLVNSEHVWQHMLLQHTT